MNFKNPMQLKTMIKKRAEEKNVPAQFVLQRKAFDTESSSL